MIEFMYKERKRLHGDVPQTFYRAVTTDMKIAKGYAEKQHTSNDNEKVLFKIKVEPQQPCTAFAYIDGISFHPEEKEVLFSMGSTFAVDGIVEPKNDETFHRVQLTASEIDKTLVDDICTKVEECSPSSRAVLLAQYLMELGQYRTARKYLSSLLTQACDGGILVNDPNFASIYSCLGMTYARQGLHSDALKAFKQALNVQARLEYSNNNALANIHNNIGLAYIGLNHMDEAEETLVKALRIQLREVNSNQQYLASIYGNIGYVYYKKDDFDKALGAFSKAEKIYKQSSSKIAHDALEQSLIKAEYLTNYGHLLSAQESSLNAQKQYSEALKLYKSIVPADDPKLMQTHMNIMFAHAQNEKYDEVTKRFEESAVQQLVDKQENNMFELNSSQKLFDKAICLWTRSLILQRKARLEQLLPGNTKDLYAIGDIYYELDKLSNAMEKYIVAENKNSDADEDDILEEETISLEESMDILKARISMHRHLAGYHKRKQAYTEAISEMNEILDILKPKLPSSTFDINDKTVLIQENIDASTLIIRLQQLANCYLQLGDIRDTEQDDHNGYKAALSIYMKLVPYDGEIKNNKYICH
ncbi:unnamed protein product [Didymodactylos carnosus]|uniref:Tetratricopeptide repeat protein n=1 Tax=Didymodactylos carnosus TaxID=1234261 RepID=A0A814NMG8_9BILA|nr:unnamed protein product [Didymodactylos carnosus]CAF1095140.1 unnamed protein product [Didymodactylos carnosus]CAF3709141.1 unnamed protein product [Didymodactylos carnosus]CAF3860381.1 unnamed protein product [Didymodactylos carnosus]